MGYPTRVQVIKRKNSRQFYVNLPSALAHAMEFKQAEVVEWIIEDKTQLVLRRSVARPSAGRTTSKASSKSSTRCGRGQGKASGKSAASRGQRRWR